MNGWHEGRVAANEREAAGLHAVHIDVSGTPLVGSHSLPGQYVRLALPELPQAGEGMFAIASGPDQTGTSFELLVKGGSDLAAVGGYDLTQFRRLLRTGVGANGRDLGEMSEVARKDLHVFTDAEIAALFAYLRSRAATER